MRLASSVALAGLGAAACANGGLDCGGVECGAAPPALVFTVADARGGAPSAAVTIANLTVPPAVHGAAHLDVLLSASGAAASQGESTVSP